LDVKHSVATSIQLKKKPTAGSCSGALPPVVKQETIDPAEEFTEVPDKDGLIDLKEKKEKKVENKLAVPKLVGGMTGVFATGSSKRSSESITVRLSDCVTTSFTTSSGHLTTYSLKPSSAGVWSTFAALYDEFKVSHIVCQMDLRSDNQTSASFVSFHSPNFAPNSGALSDSLVMNWRNHLWCRQSNSNTSFDYHIVNPQPTLDEESYTKLPQWEVCASIGSLNYGWHCLWLVGSPSVSHVVINYEYTVTFRMKH